ncbi:alpha/beta hydrolase [Bradyrhizobium lablabi]|uniref:alpha/beta fold hydrolase n=1 Tax=Bradyrhizobium lablabi TaxID=722472 RepID=UPI001BA52206|nr:alpha/beta hydrolase [Bradyrhizobium lablabi]MBR1122188.1 alpha/beta hydrolase [Bradyrhizobium lablabi]
MIRQRRFSIGSAGDRIALVQWGQSKPPALLLHGTGFCADVWDEFAHDLASEYTVYAVDRRGHGDSHKPAAGHYHFADYAEDLRRVIETLDLRDIYGIGHSAGATDLLLSAKLLPERFARLFVMEPTAMDPRAAREAALSEWGNNAVYGVLRRQAEFDSHDAAFARFRAAPAFADWTEASLRTFIQRGFTPVDNGRIRLLCMPETESAILRPIIEAMEQIYQGDARGNPFLWLSEIDLPVRVTTSEKSWPIYKEMASRAVSLIQGASTLKFDGCGHCVVQEAPTLVLEAVREFDGRARG